MTLPRNIALLLLILAGCSSPPEAAVHEGVLDLRDFEGGVVELDGEWSVTPGRLVAPGETDQDAGLVEVPGGWHRAPISGETLSPRAVATYRLEVLLPDEERDMALRLAGLSSAHRVWINGVEREGAGVISEQLDRVVAAMPVRVHSLPGASERLEIVLQIANRQSFEGGPRRALLLGDVDAVQQRNLSFVALDTLVVGVTLTVGLYYLLLFLMRNREPLWVLFGLQSVDIALITAAGGNGVLALLIAPELPWTWLAKVELVGSWWLVALGVALLRAMYPSERGRTIVTVIVGSSILGGLAALLMPVELHVRGFGLLLLAAVAGLIVVAVTLASAAIQGKDGARTLLAAVCVFGVSVLYDFGLIGSGQGAAGVATLGFLAVVLAHAGILAQAFVRSYEVIEELSEDLTVTNEALTDTNKVLTDTNTAINRFVPYKFLEVIERRSIVEVQRGDHTSQVMEIMFCDLRSFTTLIEALGPKTAFGFINEFLGHMEPEIHNHEGFISQYLGDCIMALYHGGPDEAVRSAVGMLEALERFNATQTYTGDEPVRVGIGVNSGPLMMGTIGGADRLDSGVIGDPVNLASRLEGMTKIYGTPLIIGEFTHDRLERPEDFRIRALNLVVAKGKVTPVAIYEVMDGLPQAEQDARWAMRESYATGVARYRAGDFEAAAEAFAECVAACPGDGPARLFVERCAAYIAQPPESWDGVTRLLTK